MDAPDRGALAPAECNYVALGLDYTYNDEANFLLIQRVLFTRAKDRR